jgi:hypothetical protein
LWRARHDDLRDTTAETYWARALFPLLLLDHAERVSSIRHESRQLPQPRKPGIMGPGRRPVIGRRDAPTRWPRRRNMCGEFAPDALLSISIFKQRKPIAVIPGRCEASNPESRDSGFGPSDHPGMTESGSLRSARNDVKSTYDFALATQRARASVAHEYSPQVPEILLRSIRGRQRKPPSLRELPSDPTYHSRLPASGRSPRLLCSVHAFRAISAPDLACNGPRVDIA